MVVVSLPLIVTGLLMFFDGFRNTRPFLALGLIAGCGALLLQPGTWFAERITIDFPTSPWTFLTIFITSHALSEELSKLAAVFAVTLAFRRLAWPASMLTSVGVGLTVGIGFAMAESLGDPEGIGDGLVLHSAWTAYAALLLAAGLFGTRLSRHHLVMALLLPGLLHALHNFPIIATLWFDGFGITSRLLTTLQYEGMIVVSLAIDFAILWGVAMHASVLLRADWHMPMAANALKLTATSLMLGKTLGLPIFLVDEVPILVVKSPTTGVPLSVAILVVYVVLLVVLLRLVARYLTRLLTVTPDGCMSVAPAATGTVV